MPVIREYRQQFSGRQRVTTQVNPQAASASGRALQSAGAAVFGTGLAVDAMNERKDKSELQAELARTRAEITTQLQEDVKSGAIDSDDYLLEFENRVTEQLGAVGASMRTRAGRDAASAQRELMSSEFKIQANTAKITADGQRAADNFDRALNDSGNTLLNDPTQYTAIREQWQLSFNDPNGPYAGMTAAQLRSAQADVDKNLAKWFIQGANERLGPKVARQELESGEYDDFLDADTKKQLIGQIDTEERSRQQDIARERTLRLQRQADADKATRLEMLQRMEQPDFDGLTFKEVTDSFHDPAIAEHMRNVLQQRLAAPDQISNPRVYLDVQSKIFLPPDHPDKISDPSVVTRLYSVNKQISHPNMIQLLKDIETARSQDTLGTDLQTISNQVHATFLRSPLGQIPGPDLVLLGDAAAHRWRQDVDAMIEQKREAGEDPRDLLNPKSNDYVASPERLATYLTTNQSVAANAALNIRTPQPGQVIEQGGSHWRFKGGDPTAPNAWEEIPRFDPASVPTPPVLGSPDFPEAPTRHRLPDAWKEIPRFNQASGSTPSLSPVPPIFSRLQK